MNKKIFSLVLVPTVIMMVFGVLFFSGVKEVRAQTVSWTAVSGGLSDFRVNAFAVSGSNIFAGTQSGGVFLSTNNGSSWSAVNNGLTNLFVNAFAVSGSNIFAGSANTNGGVFLSTNNGSSWSAVLPNVPVLSLAVNGSNIFAGTSDRGVFRSTDNGSSWSSVNNGLTDTRVNAITISGPNIFAGTTGRGVFRSTDNGSSWSSVLPDIGAVLSFAVNGSNIFAGSSGGVFLSTNNGSSWSSVTNGLPQVNIKALAIDGITNNIFAGATSGGVFLSTNNGSSWSAVNNGLTNLFVNALAISGSNILVGTDGGIFRASLTSAPATFATPVNYAVGANPFNVITAHLNGDPLVELITSNFSGNTVSIRYGMGNGIFGDLQNFNVGSNPRGLLAADLNRDGWNDIVTANQGGANISVILTQPNGVFNPAVSYAVGPTPLGVAVGDFNRDGWPDLVVANHGSTVLDDALDTVSILLNRGDGSFNTSTNFTAGNGAFSVLAHDFNRDGKLDLAVANEYSHNVTVLSGVGDGNFSSPVSYVTLNSTDTGPVFVIATDKNADGVIDLVTANVNETSDQDISIFYGNLDGTFNAGQAFNLGLSAGATSVSAGDFNADGRVDLVVGMRGSGGLNDNKVLVLNQNEQGNFSISGFTAQSTPSSVTNGDLNGDGKSDVVAANLSSNSISVLLNTTGADTTPPTAPTNLVAIAASSSQINLSWNASTDNVGVTGYQVHRCLGAGCSNIASIGNVTSYIDTGLTAGTTYRYMVGARDAAGNISANSNEATATTPSAQQPLNWTAMNVGLTNSYVTAATANGADTYVATYGGGVFKSTNNGALWTASNIGISNFYGRALVAKGADIYFGTDGGGVFKSTNGGSSWAASNSGLGNLFVWSLAVDNTRGVVYAGTGSGVYKTSDNGATWTSANNGISSYIIYSLAVDQATGYLYAGTSAAGIYKTVNQGLTWNAINSNLQSSDIRALAIDPATGSIYAGFWGGAGIQKSVNGGENWTVANSGLTGNIFHAFAIKNSIIYAASEAYGVFASYNGGTSWTQETTGMGNKNTRALVINDANYVFAGTWGSSVYRASIAPPPPVSPIDQTSTTAVVAAGGTVTVAGGVATVGLTAATADVNNIKTTCTNATDAQFVAKRGQIAEFSCVAGDAKAKLISATGVTEMPVRWIATGFATISGKGIQMGDTLTTKGTLTTVGAEINERASLLVAFEAKKIFASGLEATYSIKNEGEAFNLASIATAVDGTVSSNETIKSDGQARFDLSKSGYTRAVATFPRVGSGISAYSSSVALKDDSGYSTIGKYERNVTAAPAAIQTTLEAYNQSNGVATTRADYWTFDLNANQKVGIVNLLTEYNVNSASRFATNLSVTGGIVSVNAYTASNGFKSTLEFADGNQGQLATRQAGFGAAYYQPTLLGGRYPVLKAKLNSADPRYTEVTIDNLYQGQVALLGSSNGGMSVGVPQSSTIKGLIGGYDGMQANVSYENAALNAVTYAVTYPDAETINVASSGDFKMNGVQAPLVSGFNTLSAKRLDSQLVAAGFGGSSVSADGGTAEAIQIAGGYEISHNTTNTGSFLREEGRGESVLAGKTKWRINQMADRTIHETSEAFAIGRPLVSWIGSDSDDKMSLRVSYLQSGDMVVDGKRGSPLLKLHDEDPTAAPPCTKMSDLVSKEKACMKKPSIATVGNTNLKMTAFPINQQDFVELNGTVKSSTNSLQFVPAFAHILRTDCGPETVLTARPVGTNSDPLSLVTKTIQADGTQEFKMSGRSISDGPEAIAMRADKSDLRAVYPAKDLQGNSLHGDRIFSVNTVSGKRIVEYRKYIGDSFGQVKGFTINQADTVTGQLNAQHELVTYTDSAINPKIEISATASGLLFENLGAADQKISSVWNGVNAADFKLSAIGNKFETVVSGKQANYSARTQGFAMKDLSIQGGYNSLNVDQVVGVSAALDNEEARVTGQASSIFQLGHGMRRDRDTRFGEFVDQSISGSYNTYIRADANSFAAGASPDLRSSLITLSSANQIAAGIANELGVSAGDFPAVAGIQFGESANLQTTKPFRKIVSFETDQDISDGDIIFSRTGSPVRDFKAKTLEDKQTLDAYFTKIGRPDIMVSLYQSEKETLASGKFKMSYSFDVAGYGNITAHRGRQFINNITDRDKDGVAKVFEDKYGTNDNDAESNPLVIGVNTTNMTTVIGGCRSPIRRFLRREILVPCIEKNSPVSASLNFTDANGQVPVRDTNGNVIGQPLFTGGFVTVVVDSKIGTLNINGEHLAQLALDKTKLFPKTEKVFLNTLLPYSNQNSINLQFPVEIYMKKNTVDQFPKICTGFVRVPFTAIDHACFRERPLLPLKESDFAVENLFDIDGDIVKEIEVKQSQVRGSILNIVEPVNIIISSATQEVPFVYDSPDNYWDIVTSFVPPVGCTSDVPEQSVHVDQSVEAAVFTLTCDSSLFASRKSNLARAKSSLTAQAGKANPKAQDAGPADQANAVAQGIARVRTEARDCTIPGCPSQTVIGEMAVAFAKPSPKGQEHGKPFNGESASLWSTVKDRLGKNAPNSLITQMVREVAENNSIAIPEWDIKGRIDSRALSATALKVLSW